MVNVIKSVSSYIDDYGFGLFQVKQLFAAGGSWSLSGCALFVIGAVAPLIAEEWSLNPKEKGILLGLPFLGVLLGNLMGGSIGDSIGRRLPCLATSFGLILLSGILIFGRCQYIKDLESENAASTPAGDVSNLHHGTAATHGASPGGVQALTDKEFQRLVYLGVWMLFLGMSCGLGQPSCNSLLGELSPTKYRIHMIALSQVLFASGELVAALVFACRETILDSTMKHLEGVGLVKEHDQQTGSVVGHHQHPNLYYIDEATSFLNVDGGVMNGGVHHSSTVDSSTESSLVKTVTETLLEPFVSFGPFLSSTENWCALVILAILPLALIAAVYGWLFLSESPRFLLNKGKETQTIEVLRTITAHNEKKSFYECPISYICGFGYVDEQVPPASEYMLRLDTASSSVSPLARTKSQGGVEQTAFQRLKDVLFHPVYRKTTWIMAYTSFVLNFLFYGGLYAFLQVLGLDASGVLVLGTFSRFPGYAAGLYIGDRLATRKASLQLYLVFTVLSVVLFLIGYRIINHHGDDNEGIIIMGNTFLNAGIFLYQGILAAGVLLVYVYALEIYPTECRSTGTAVNLACGRMGSIICALTFESMATNISKVKPTSSFLANGTVNAESKLDPTYFFLLVIFLAITNAILISSIPYETKNSNLEALEENIERTKTQ